MEPDTHIEKKRPIWDALSDLFLNTELDRDDLQRIARVLAGTEFTLEELEQILFEELYPVLISNLHSPAGEWASFELDWSDTTILASPRRPGKRWS